MTAAVAGWEQEEWAEEHGPMAAMPMLVDRVTRVQVTREWLTRARDTLVTARRR